MTNKKELNIIIIGSGIGGLTVGALLVKKGHKVKIFEKESLIGGRALTLNMSSFNLKSYENLLSRFHMHVPFSEPALEIIFEKKMLNGYYLDLGFHVMGGGVISNLRNVLSTSEVNIEMIKSRLYTQKNDHYGLFVTNWDKVKMIPNLLRLFLSGEKTMKQLDETSIADTIKKYGKGKVKVVLEANPRLITTVNNLDSISTGEVFRTQRNMKLKGVRYPKKSLSHIMYSLAEFIRRNGGEIHINTPVTKILINENKAKGIVAGGKKYSCDVVISNILVQDLLKIADEKHFTKDYIKSINSLDGTGSLCAYYSLKKINPDLPGKNFVFIERDAGIVGDDAAGMIDFMVTLPESGLAPPSHHLVQSYVICTPDEAKNKETLEKLKKILDRNLEKIIPDFHSNLRWVIYPAIWHLDGVSKVIGNKKPGIKTPVDNLYLVGDCVNAPGIGINCALNSARLLADMLFS